MQSAIEDTLTQKNAAFSISDNFRFGMLFANGWRLSLGIGEGHYCISKPLDRNTGYIAKDCEIAIFDSEEQMVTFKSGDQVLSHVTPEKLVEVIQWIANQPPN